MCMLSKLSNRELVKLIKQKCIPPLLPKFHKGQSGGRVCIIGGCEDYTGAPYFSANATALVGCDLTHVVCEQNAATVIKSYSPNLMVHPYLKADGQGSEMGKIKSLLSRIHVVVIGPGLGRDASMLDAVKRIIGHLLTEHGGEIPIVIDADALYLVSQDKEVRETLAKFPQGRIILTPNVVEFKRLYDAVVTNESTAEAPEAANNDENLQGYEIAQRMNCVVIQKGLQDKIFSPAGKNELLVNEQTGSNKRVGGQGDTLTGTIACMLSFSRAMFDFKLCGDPSAGEGPHLRWVDYAMLSCYAGCSITRECAHQAFKATGRAMQTTDLNDRVGQVYHKLFE
ncbi:NADHX dehydratase KNAG_0F02790 [Huiozyma naganishii CBS 8797]|uniref:ATP-dependent (S)-NAD(P)H-hydrate dehydratase n=1 Tax=Huiozyma naganishii (strain ATCC MYA-139 / BCRC 22969 / CBS 8797 / KCTC 17520 / NBRC 10181 / NCYC 3082 / Yp74L-3) TaxID=1071383 RepID=J7S8I7_HUIN7|nr:hypothetical protein KNAG_0F02790 [Kazachstania naganishii CBS 8797]CCK70941.1 hypothetical protein KNAG_0F02790 [Kazachstania naganishii CBS 8797]